VDGENGDYGMNLEHEGRHASACARLHVLRSARGVRKTCGESRGNDTVKRTGSVCE